MAHHLGVDEYRLSVRTIGSGGIDEPIGVFPDLHMSWMPIFSKKCTMCVDRKSEGKKSFCMMSCPARAIIHGDIDDPESSISKKRAELLGRSYREFTMPAWENTRQPVYYYTNGM
jgi:Fe-S-cluster-containing dehydrogenase component